MSSGATEEIEATIVVEKAKSVDTSGSMVDALDKMVKILAESTEGGLAMEWEAWKVKRIREMKHYFALFGGNIMSGSRTYEDYLARWQEDLLAIRDMFGRTVFTNVMEKCQNTGVDESAYMVILNLKEAADIEPYERDVTCGVDLVAHANQMAFRKAMMFPEFQHLRDSPEALVAFWYEGDHLNMVTCPSYDPNTNTYTRGVHCAISHKRAQKMLHDIDCVHHYLFEKIE